MKEKRPEEAFGDAPVRSAAAASDASKLENDDLPQLPQNPCAKQSYLACPPGIRFPSGIIMEKKKKKRGRQTKLNSAKRSNNE
jgi:hypothetical protein